MINNYTKNGKEPSWSTIRYRFWKNYSDMYYSDMRTIKGMPPIGSDGFFMELHHPNGREGDNIFLFNVVTYTKHKEIHYGN